MSHSHCADEHHDGHDHDDHDDGSGPRDNLFQYIDLPNCVALNASGTGQEPLKPWNLRLDETKSLESDADDQLILRVPFTGNIRLRSVLIKSGPTDQTPSKVCLFANRDNLDFDDVADTPATQEFDVPQGREVGEYAVKASKFSNVTSITLFFPASQGAETTQIYYVGFLGHWSERKANPIITVYETQANLADHEKIQGLDGAFSAPGM